MKQLLSSLKRAVRGKSTVPGHPFELALADRVDYLNAAHWDALVAGRSLFMGRDYLRALARTVPPGVAGRYALVYRGDTPVAAVSAQRLALDETSAVSTTAARAPERKRDRLKQAMGAVAVRSLPRTFILCGNVWTWGPHGIAVAADAPWDVLAGVGQALQALRRRERLLDRTGLVVVRDLPDQRYDAGLAEAGFRAVVGDPDMVLEVPKGWTSFDDYLQSLNTKYRKAALALNKQVEAADWRVETLADVKPHAAALHALYVNVWSRAASRGPAVSPEYIPALAEALGPRHRVIVVRQGAKIGGFVTVIADGETAFGYLVGFDYDLNREVPVYLRLLQAVIAESIALGCRRISVGGTALEPKARLGFKPVARTHWIWHANPIKNAALAPLLALVPHEEAPDRSPFKA